MSEVLDSITEQVAETLEELRSLAKSKKLMERIGYLEDRLDRAHRPGQAQQPQPEVHHRPADLRRK